jgi:hypothetical protein
MHSSTSFLLKKRTTAESVVIALKQVRRIFGTAEIELGPAFTPSSSLKR